MGVKRMMGQKELVVVLLCISWVPVLKGVLDDERAKPVAGSSQTSASKSTDEKDPLLEAVSSPSVVPQESTVEGERTPLASPTSSRGLHHEGRFFALADRDQILGSYGGDPALRPRAFFIETTEEGAGRSLGDHYMYRMALEEPGSPPTRRSRYVDLVQCPAPLQPLWKKVKPFATAGFWMASGWVMAELVISQAWEPGGLCTGNATHPGGKDSIYQASFLDRLTVFLRQYMVSHLTSNPPSVNVPFSQPTSFSAVTTATVSTQPESSFFLTPQMFQNHPSELEIKVFDSWPGCQGAYVARLWKESYITVACLENDGAALLGSDEPDTLFIKGPVMSWFACQENPGWIEMTTDIFGYGVTHLVGNGLEQVVTGLNTFSSGLGDATRDAFSDVVNNASHFALLGCVSGFCQQTLPTLLSSLAQDSCQGFAMRHPAASYGSTFNTTQWSNMSDVWRPF